MKGEGQEVMDDECYLTGDESLVLTQIGSEEIQGGAIVTHCSVVDEFRCSVAIEGALIARIHSREVR